MTRAITLLHLSDLQFGQHHRFGSDETSPLSSDSLLTSLTRDLDELQREHDVTPDLVVLTGDLAERGAKPEFEQLFQFLVRLTEHLKLTRDRVALVPGNHDINWHACQAYFSNCLADGVEPRPPYADKWRHFVWLFQEFYREHPSITFPEGQPWTLFEIPELSVVIAGMNSTMAESHRDEDHYGLLGRQQIDWFAERLRLKAKLGWLRIGALHHNIRRGAVSDDENLRDAELLDPLAAYLNVILHGHTHQGKADWLSPKVPVLSTGSAAVAGTARPAEIPNQYQLIRFTQSGIRRWTRSYLPELQRWGGDNRGSASADQWIIDEAVGFDRVASALGSEERAPEPPPARGITHRVDDLLSLVERACRAGATQTISTEQHRDVFDPLPYLLVIEREPPFSRAYVIGVAENGIDEAALRAFAETVHARHHRYDQRTVSKLVYGGNEPAPPDLVDKAQLLGIHLQSFVQFKGLIDFRSYVQQQSNRIHRDPRYPSELYVPQHARYEIGGDAHMTEHVLNDLERLMIAPEGRFILVLGEFGTGKSFLLRQLALRLSQPDRPEPILIEMRTLEKAKSLDELIGAHLIRSGFDVFNLRAFRYMLEDGRMVLLFDGFDELAGRISYDRSVEHFNTVLQAVRGSAKVVVSSRTQFFESEAQIRTALAEKVDSIQGHRILHLQRFTRMQVETFLRNHLKDEKAAARRIALLGQINDLMGLSENPRMLSFIAELPEEDLRKAAERTGAITSADLYRLLIQRWLQFEQQRAEPLSWWDAVSQLALHLWQKVDPTARLSELSEQLGSVIAAIVERKMEVGEATHQFASGTLLVRDEEGNFSFVHQSILEWFVADRAAKELAEGGASAVMDARALSPLMADFVNDLAGAAASRWATFVLAEAASSANSTLKSNALLVLGRENAQPVETAATAAPSQIHLAGTSLRGTDFSRQELFNAKFTHADLTAARFVDASAPNADFRNARLVGADLTRAYLRGADFRYADLSHARLLQADLGGAGIDGASFRRAKLIGARLPKLDGCDMFGASRTNGRYLTPIFEGPINVRHIAWSPDGELLAFSDGAVVRLWDVDSGEELRRFRHPGGSPSRLVFCNDGRLIAATGQNQVIMFWETDTGRGVWNSSRLGDGVVSVHLWGRDVVCAFDRSGSIIYLDPQQHEERRLEVVTGRIVAGRRVEGSDDCVLITTDGNLLRVTSSGPVASPMNLGNIGAAAISPDGRFAAVADAATLNVVNSLTGATLISRSMHTTAIEEIAFSADGARTATQSRGGTVRLWESETGTLLATFEGRATGHGLAFDSGGTRLASGFFNGEVRIWEVPHGKEVRLLASSAQPVAGIAIDKGDRLIVQDHSGLSVWNMSDGVRTRRQTESFNPLAVSGSGQYALHALGGFLYVTNVDGTSNALQVAAPTSLGTAAIDHYGSIVAFHEPSSDTVYFVEPWDPRHTERWDLRNLTGGDLAGMQFDPRGQYLIGWSYSGVWLWRRSTGDVAGHWKIPLVRRATVHAAQAIAVAGGGRLTLLGTAEGPREREGAFDAVAFNPDGTRLAAGDENGHIRIFDVKSFERLIKLVDHDGPITHLAFNATGQLLASASEDGTVRIWHLASARTAAKPAAIFASLESGAVAWGPDRRFKAQGEIGRAFGFTDRLCRFTPEEAAEHGGLRLGWKRPQIGLWR
jgi:WD40 repeat protein/3',5'-cyclic AMP phosphodiesterase CpdA